MKIIILSDNFPPYTTGGAEWSTFYLARAFQKKGHEVFIITICREKSAEGRSDYQGLRVFKVYSGYHERWRGYLSLYNPQTVGKIGKLMKEIKPDIVHANIVHCHLSYYSLKIAQKYSKGVFITIRDAMPFNYGKMATGRYLKKFDYRTFWFDHLKQSGFRYNPLRNLIIRHYLKYADKIFAISGSLKKALEENKIKNVEVIYNGINIEEWETDPGLVDEFKEKYNLQNKKVILFGGRLSKLKGGEEIIKAMKSVAELVPQALLLIAGKTGGYTQEMLRLAERLGVKDRIVFTGWLDREQLKLFFASADVVTVPSVYFDSFNLFNIEAMAAKKPVVGTCFGGTPEIVIDGKTGFIVDPRDTVKMAERIVDLLKNPRRAEQFGEEGFLRVKEYFNLDKQADKYLEYFFNALNSSATPLRPKV